jgi:hypothetical protein
MSGDYVVFNCEVNFPNDQVVPYVVQWWRKVNGRGFELRSSFAGNNVEPN